MARESVGWIDTATGELPEYPRKVDLKTPKKVYLKI
jgi:hypothetical protein